MNEQEQIDMTLPQNPCPNDPFYYYTENGKRMTSFFASSLVAIRRMPVWNGCIWQELIWI